MLKDLLYEYVNKDPKKAIENYKQTRQKIVYDQNMDLFDTFDDKLCNSELSKISIYKQAEKIRHTQSYK